MSTGYPSNLSDAEWKCLQGYLPPLPKRGRPPIHSLRAIFDAIFYVLRTGCPWRYLPANFPPWPTVSYHFRRLRIKGTWTLLLRALHRAERERQGRHPDPSAESRGFSKRENGRGVVWDLWLRCPQTHQRAQTAHPRGYAGHPHLYAMRCRHRRVGRSSQWGCRGRWTKATVCPGDPPEHDECCRF